MASWAHLVDPQPTFPQCQPAASLGTPQGWGLPLLYPQALEAGLSLWAGNSIDVWRGVGGSWLHLQIDTLPSGEGHSLEGQTLPSKLWE